jgi:isocitrate lyase
LDQETIARFQKELGAMGYRFQFVTLAGFHLLNLSMYELARAYRDRGMAAYSELQEREFALEADNYRAVKHQRFVGTSYFDAVQQVIAGGNSSVTALKGSTEEAQFTKDLTPLSIAPSRRSVPKAPGSTRVSKNF